MTNPEIASHLQSLTQAVILLSDQLGARLDSAQLCARIGCHRNTLVNLKKDPAFPSPVGSKWLLSDVLEWEKSKATRH